MPFALRGRPIRGLGTFSDAGALDHQTAAAAWGDGVVSQTFAVFNDAFGGVEGHVEAPHAYAAAGQYTVTLRVADDDAGMDEATADVTIVTPAQAIGSVVGMLDTLIATATNPALKHLQAARKALAGQGSGQTSGALNKINEGQTSAALAHLTNALSDLGKATGVDTTVIIAILQEVVASLQP